MRNLQVPEENESSHKVAGLGAGGKAVWRGNEFGGQQRGKEVEAQKRVCGWPNTHPGSHEG